IAVVSSLRTAPSSARAPAAAARTTPERALRLPGQGISWLSSTSTSVKSLRLNSKCGSSRSMTPTDSIGSGSEPAGRMRSVAARTAACRCATVGLRASASATSDSRTESPATDVAEPCPSAGPAPAITSALVVRISCRTCIPLLVPFQLDSSNLPTASLAGSWNGTRQSVSGGTRRSPRRYGRRVRAHYAWERLGLGRRRERRLWIGRDERGKTERDAVRLSSRDGDAYVQREHRICRDRAKGLIGAGGGVGSGIHHRPRR